MKKTGSFQILKFLILATLIGVGVVFWFNHDGSVSKQPIRNVLLISMDTTRADHLSCYRYHRKTTPCIDSIAEEGILFERVVAPVPLTMPSHSTMLTGTIPPHHGAHDNLSYALDSSQLTLAEILKDHGFSTLGIVSAAVLDDRYGLDQGFDTYNDEFEDAIKDSHVVQRRGDETSRLAVEWMKEHQDERFFMFIHFYDPHATYDPPEPFASRFQDDPYAGEIAFTDDCIRHIIETLKELNLYDSTLIVITGDHGELLGQHGEAGHMYFIYQGALVVPLIFKVPGRNDPQRINSVAGVVDVTPTICSLLDIEMPIPVQGEDLSCYFDGDSSADIDRYVYCESLTPTKYLANSLLGIVGNRWKYIQTTRPELYDLLVDPEEANNLCDEQPDVARDLRDRLSEMMEASVRDDRSTNRVRPDAVAIEKLKSLGYIAGNVDEDFSFDQVKDDPKDLIGFHNDFKRLEHLAAQAQYDEAKVLCAELLSQRPQIVDLHLVRSRIALSEDDSAEALRCLSTVVDLDPEHFQSLMSLGDMYESAGNVDQAIQYFGKAVNVDPSSDAAHYDLARMYHRQGNVGAALEHANIAARLNPDSLEVRASLAHAYCQRKDYESALEHYYKIVEFQPDLISNLNTLARILATTDNPAIQNPTDALKFSSRACELSRNSVPELLDTLAIAYAANDRFPRAIETAKMAINVAGGQGDANFIEQLRNRLALFEAGKPYREYLAK